MNHNTMRSLRKATLLILTMLALGASPTFAQSITLNGTVLDKSNGDPLIGATIVEDGTTNATSAGADGTFTIKVNALPLSLIHISEPTRPY